MLQAVRSEVAVVHHHTSATLKDSQVLEEFFKSPTFSAHDFTILGCLPTEVVIQFHLVPLSNNNNFNTTAYSLVCGSPILVLCGILAYPKVDLMEVSWSQQVSSPYVTGFEPSAAARQVRME